jgi:hypothetical protein
MLTPRSVRVLVGETEHGNSCGAAQSRSPPATVLVRCSTHPGCGRVPNRGVDQSAIQQLKSCVTNVRPVSATYKQVPGQP